MARPQKFRLSPDEVLEPQHARKLAGHVSEIEFFRTQVEGLQQQIAGIYDAADEDGFDKKFVRKAVARRARDMSEFEAAENATETYLIAVEKGLSTRTRERNPKNDHEDTTQNTSNSGDDSEENADLVTAPETQPDPQAGSDLTTSHALDNGQVAHIQPETANETPSADIRADGMGVDIVAPIQDQPETANELLGGFPVAAAEFNAEETGAVSIPSVNKDRANVSVTGVTAGETATKPMYAEPGVVVWESAPPEGVARHPYSNLFGTYGQDIAVIEGDLDAANAAPIVKIGNVILDGWARYTMARSMGTSVLQDGVTKRIPLEYPVVQYDGSDALIDCIKWNLDGRLMTSEQKFRVAQALSRMEPKRKNDIYAAFELETEMAI